MKKIYIKYKNSKNSFIGREKMKKTKILDASIASKGDEPFATTKVSHELRVMEGTGRICVGGR